MAPTPSPFDRIERLAARFTDAAFPQGEVLTGAAQDRLPLAGRGQFRCVVTSPPYYRKRFYPIPDSVFGGDPTCDHDWMGMQVRGVSGGSGPASTKQASKGSENYQESPDHEQAVCVTCMAWKGQLGWEPELCQYIDHLAGILHLTSPLLTDDGTLWVVIGDTYAGSGKGPSGVSGVIRNQGDRQGFVDDHAYVPKNMKPKDLMGVPYELARVLRARGWYWRQDVIWDKPSVPTESVKDRNTWTYEHVLMFSKSRYYFHHPVHRLEDALTGPETFRNKRNVWRVTGEPTGYSHFAAYPTALAEECILLGSEIGDWVLDPFGGIARTGTAALNCRRNFVGVEIGEAYALEGRRRLEQP